MINTSNSGLLVETKSGKIGRTYHKDGLIGGKVPVYLSIANEMIIDKEGYSLTFSGQKILCDPSTLKHLGFID